jgi:hypothetical protein
VITYYGIVDFWQLNAIGVCVAARFCSYFNGDNMKKKKKV